MNNVRVRFSIL